MSSESDSSEYFSAEDNIKFLESSESESGEEVSDIIGLLPYMFEPTRENIQSSCLSPYSDTKDSLERSSPLTAEI